MNPELKLLERLQRINTGLIEIGMPYEERKENLMKCATKWVFWNDPGTLKTEATAHV